jgi:hypothetical protein
MDTTGQYRATDDYEALGLNEWEHYGVIFHKKSEPLKSKHIDKV